MIRVETPGLLTTVQDLGRDGYGPIGVSASGAADPVALRIGNRLLGNAEGDAALEMTLVGGVFRFGIDTWIAITGSDFDAQIDGSPVENWEVHALRAGQVLRMQATASGARCYLCVSGGIQVPLVLGSASTHVLSAMGGCNGRPLRKGDTLSTGSPAAPAARRVNPRIVQRLAPRRSLRVTAGVQSGWVAEGSRQRLFEGPYRVTEASNRMGLRLDGAAVELQAPAEMITEGVAVGAVQIPASGQPLIVFVEAQTTGGYPVVANVISADLPSVGQLRPRDAVQFEPVSHEQARVLLLEQEALLASGDLLVT